jgi:hypothetical protein
MHPGGGHPTAEGHKKLLAPSPLTMPCLYANADPATPAPTTIRSHICAKHEAVLFSIICSST